MVVSNMRRLIQEVLEPIGLYSKNAEELLILTVAAESLGGQYLYQTQGPARGFTQMEPATENDILTNYVRYKPELRDALKQYIKFEADGTWSYRVNKPLTYCLDYQIIMARIHYMRDKFNIPPHTDIEGLASYWKRVYNTYKGKGTVAKAIQKYMEYIG